jgi:hypothetical protein
LENLGLILRSRFLFSLNRQSRFLPGIESALKGPNLIVSALLKFLRQPGA